MNRPLFLTLAGVLLVALAGWDCAEDNHTANAASTNSIPKKADDSSASGTANARGPASIDQRDTSDAATATQLAADKEKGVKAEKADAIAHIKPAKNAPQDMQVTGNVRFMKADDGLKVMVNLKGFKPDSKHGFHIHEKGDLDSPDLKSAGGHFNPGGHKHGGPDTEMHHAGDLGNITADEKGNVKTTIMAKGITLDDEKTGIMGRSVIVHEKADDLKTDPAGDSGARIAGGKIEAPKAK
jgi:Cu-Zn family superoxide dismutase